jgi:four helix bundle protein
MGSSAGSAVWDLEVWQKSHQLTLRIYKLTAGFPKHELYGLSSQMRRAAVSVPSNIAEAFQETQQGPDKARVHEHCTSLA